MYHDFKLHNVNSFAKEVSVSIQKLKKKVSLNTNFFLIVILVQINDAIETEWIQRKFWKSFISL